MALTLSHIHPPYPTPNALLILAMLSMNAGFLVLTAAVARRVGLL